jgi:hypothetical protein
MRGAKRLAGPVGAAMLAAVAGCAEQARFRHSADLQAVHRAASPIEARTENGAITLSRGSGPDVVIHADIKATTQTRADATVVTSERRDDGTLLIAVEWPEGRRLDNESCSLNIKVPDAVGVRLFTSNGDIDAKGMAGEGEMRTSNGSVVVTDHAGRLSAHTSNGGIVLTNVAGPVDADTSNGAIEMRGVGGPVRAETSNGGVAIALDPSAPGPVDVTSSNGSIRLEVGPAFVGEVWIDTSNGGIDVSGAGASMATRGGRAHASVTFGSGGERSTLSTSNGGVTVRRR